MTKTYLNQSYNFIDTSELNIPTNVKKLNILSLFSGVGGMDLGFIGGFDYLGKYYDKNPFQILFANDIFKQAGEVYEYNFKHEVNQQDIREIELEDITNESVDIVLGGFPCQTFSYAGKRDGLSDPRGQLYQEMIRVLNYFQPKMFIAENVDGIRNSRKNSFGINVDKSALDHILEEFEKNGYNVQYHVLNSADYGVPQLRRRVIIMGIRKDLGDIENQFYPKPTHTSEMESKNRWLTAKDGIEDLWDKIDKTPIPKHTYKDYSKAKFYPGRKMQGNNRIDANKPSPTIRAEHHGNIEAHYNHILEDEHDMKGWRRLSVRECARLQSFPDDFNFVS